MLPEDAAEAALKQVADMRLPHPSRGDDRETGQIRTRRLGPDPGGKDEGRPKLAAAFLSNGREIRLAAEPLPGTESHGLERRPREARLVSDDGKALAPLAAAIGQDRASVVGGLTRAKPDFAGALLVVRTVSWLHGGRKRM